MSGVLCLTRYLEKPSATVPSVRENLEKAGWEVANGEPRAGDVLVWESMTFEDGTVNSHIGFAVSAEEAVSTSWANRNVEKHHVTFGVDEAGNPKRKIVAVLRKII